jgi:hypothetical protein
MSESKEKRSAEKQKKNRGKKGGVEEHVCKSRMLAAPKTCKLAIKKE